MTASTRIVGVVAVNSTDYVEKVYALLRAGAVVVPLRSAVDDYRLRAAAVSEIVEPAERHGWLDSRFELDDRNQTALIAFTSGTEGQPKGVVLTHANLANTVRRMRAAMQLDGSVREYVGIPVYHSFGFGRCRLIAAVGGRAYVPPSGFDLRELCAMLEAGEINSISTVPSLWRLVLNHRDLVQPHAHKVRWIEIGSQPMSAEEKRELRTLFSNARIVQHYGLTEASRSTFLDVSSASEAELGSVGAPNGDVEIRITDGGRIAIRGGHVAAEVIVDGQRMHNVDNEGWLVTSDLGAFVGGKVEFLGRADDLINCGGLKISPDQLESEIKTALGLSRGLSVSKVPDAARGDGILVAIETAVEPSDAAVHRATAKALLGFGVNAESAIRTMRMEALPTTDSGKVRRRDLTLLYLEQHRPAGAPAGSRVNTARKPRTVRAVFARVFPGRTVVDTDTFVGLGGDSLSFVEVSITLEEILGDLPHDWQNVTVAELERSRKPRAAFHAVDTTLLLRLVCIVTIVTGHFTGLDIGGATFPLLAVVGYNFARFQLPNVLTTNSVVSILSSAAKIAIPTILVIGAIEIRQGEMNLGSLALLNNWHDAADADIDLWFIELVVQVLLFMAALLLIPAVRTFARSRAWLFSLTLLLASIAAARFVPLVWSSAHLYDRIPHMLLWLFALGVLLGQAETTARKATVAILILAAPPLLWGASEVPFWIAHGKEWFWVGCLLLLAFPRIPVPYPINRLAYWVGGASMFIYILHSPVQHAWQAITPVRSGPVEVVIAILAGVVAWWIWDYATRMLVRGYTKQRDSAPSRARSSSRGSGVPSPPPNP